MPKQYLVSQKPYLFVDAMCETYEESQYISYRMVLCHAIHHAIHELKANKEDIHNRVKALSEFGIKAIPNGDFDFLETRILTDHEGVLVVDHTDGCYPLVLRFNAYASDRKDGFKMALKNIDNQFEDIYNILTRPAFDEAIHCKLEHYFN